MTLYDETLDALREVEQRIPFNRSLGVEMTRFDADGVAMTLPMRDDLVGNWTRGNLHGGVISATLDLVGGMVAIHAAVARGYLDSVERIREAFTSMGTIDLRVDYLRPALGDHFAATGHALRVGRSVTVTRMELRDPDDVLCAVGTGAYRVDAG